MELIVFSDGTYFEFDLEKVRVLDIPDDDVDAFDYESDSTRWNLAQLNGTRLEISERCSVCRHPNELHHGRYGEYCEECPGQECDVH